MKKIFVILICCVITTVLTGCTEEKNIIINVENDTNLNNTTVGKDALIEIGNELYYDFTTRIVYWWNGSLNNGINAGRCNTTPTPYYAPNGLPYRYNPETNTFEEIKWSE